jgi:hypothetical protein
MGQVNGYERCADACPAYASDKRPRLTLRASSKPIPMRQVKEP